MPQFLDRLLTPEIVWVTIPLTAIIFFGLTQMVRSFRRSTHDFDDWKAELDDLRARVDALERQQRGSVVADTDDRIAARRR